MKHFVIIEIIFFSIIIVLFASGPSTGSSCGDECDRVYEQCKTDCKDSWDWFRGGCNCVLCEIELTIKAPPYTCNVASELWISHGNTEYLKDPVDVDGDLISTRHTNEGGGSFTRFIVLDECIYPDDEFDITNADLHTSTVYICAPAEPCTNYPEYRWGEANLMSLKNLITGDVNEHTCDLLVTIDVSNEGDIKWLKTGNQKCFTCCNWGQE